MKASKRLQRGVGAPLWWVLENRLPHILSQLSCSAGIVTKTSLKDIATSKLEHARVSSPLTRVGFTQREVLFQAWQARLLWRDHAQKWICANVKRPIVKAITLYFQYSLPQYTSANHLSFVSLRSLYSRSGVTATPVRTLLIAFLSKWGVLAYRNCAVTLERVPVYRTPKMGTFLTLTSSLHSYPNPYIKCTGVRQWVVARYGDLKLLIAKF